MRGKRGKRKRRPGCQKLERTARELGFDITTSYGIGKHDFIYWDEELKKVIYTWLPV